MFLCHFLQFLFQGRDFRFHGLDGGLVLWIVAGDDEGGRDQLGGVFLFADGEVGLGFGFVLLVVDDELGLGGLFPAVARVLVVLAIYAGLSALEHHHGA